MKLIIATFCIVLQAPPLVAGNSFLRKGTLDDQPEPAHDPFIAAVKKDEAFFSVQLDTEARLLKKVFNESDESNETPPPDESDESNETPAPDESFQISGTTPPDESQGTPSPACPPPQPADPDQWCRDLGGNGALANAASWCYATFSGDCYCRDGYVIAPTLDECLYCNRDERDTFCRNAWGDGAQAKPDQDCWNDVHDDCQCSAGYRFSGDFCVSCNMDTRDQWCRDELGDGARAKDGQECYDDYASDCECADGYILTDGECKNCNQADPDGWCERAAKAGGEAAFADPNQHCHYDFEKHCLCDDGYFHKYDKCEKDCHKREPDKWCYDVGGEGAYAKDKQDCYDDFERHCQCFDGYDQTSEGCDKKTERFDTNNVRLAGKDGFPESAYPLRKCEGDCDHDRDCAEGLICFQREYYEEVPGCSGGAYAPKGYDYCIYPTTPSPTGAPTPPSPTYTMSFVGRFQKVEEPGCSIPHPIARAGCSKSSISLISVSDPSIVCSEPIGTKEVGYYLICSPSCEGSDCEFLGTSFDSDFGNSSKFGEVYFECETDSLSSGVAGWFEVNATEGGCIETEGVEVGGAFQTSQLGVSCPDLGGFIFEDDLFDCNSGTPITINGSYSCTSGKPCYGKSCEFSLANVKVTGDSYRFPKVCIASSDRSPIPQIAPPAPAYSNSNTSTVKAVFQLDSGFYYNESSCPGTTLTGLAVTCTNGNISMIESQSTMSCFKVNENMIVCSESCVSTPRNEYIGILRYECSSFGETPQTTAVNLGSTIDCFESGELSMYLQLGVFCGGDSYINNKNLFECGDGSTLVSQESEMACGISGMANVSAPYVTGPVEIRTDFRWGLIGPELCLSYQSAPVTQVERTVPDQHDLWT